MKKLLQKIYYAVAIIATLFIINVANAQQFKVIGYIPSWGNGPTLINTMDYSQLTHINYSFQNPDWSGNLTSPNTGLTTLVSNGHAANVKILVALGGAGTDYDANLKAIWQSLMTPANRGAFIQKISDYVNLYNLDGVDVDIEGSGINGDYDGFVIALCNALQPQGKLVSAAVKSDFGNPGLVNACLSKLDYINVMAYDQIGNWVPTPGQHSSYSYATGMVDYWKGRGVPANKIILGVPFYGYGWNGDSGSWSYASILARYPGTQNGDQAGNIIYFNGINTIKSKTTYACQNSLGGIMIWELTNDVTGPNSLLKAIHDAMGPCGTVPPTVTITSPANNASFAAPANITINATATIATGSISKVEFFNGSSLLFTDLNAPYSYNWNNVAAGAYTINVKATSNTGSTATASITIHVTGPHGGTPWPIPGKVEAEDYDEGGQGFGYNDVTPGNSGAGYRTEDVDIEPLAGGGYDVGYTAAGEWMKYAVNVAATGKYNFEVRVATTTTGRSFHIEMDGVNITGAINLPNTGAWTTYQIVTVTNVSLTQGLHSMKVVMDTDGFNLDYVNVISAPGLPVDLISFSGSKIDVDHNRLVWNVANERKFSHYILERSANGNSDFEDVSFIYGSADHVYSYLDYTEGKNYYYRLKMVDLDETYSFSNIIYVSGESNLDNNFTIQKINEEYFLSYQSVTSQNANLYVFDLTGKEILKVMYPLEIGNNAISLKEFDGLSKGIYIVSFITEKGIQSRKFLK